VPFFPLLLLLRLNILRIVATVTFSAFKEIPWHEYGRLAMELSILTLRTPFMDNDLVRLTYQAPLDTRSSFETRFRLIEDNNPDLYKIITDRGTAGNHNLLFSGCARFFAYALFKAEYVYLHQLPHWMVKLDSALRPFHPERLLVGLYQLGQYRLWFRDELSGYVQDILLDDRTAKRPYVNRVFLEKLVREHTNGDSNYTAEINKMITAELIYRLLVENI